MKKLFIIFAVCMCASIYARITNETYKIEVNTNGMAFLKGIDGQERPVAVLGLEEYSLLTGRLEKVWGSIHKTESGRRSIHGIPIKRNLDEDKKIITIEYPDGYKHHEKMTKHASVNRRPPDIRKSENIKKPKNISSRQWAAKLKRQNKIRKEITIEFAPGGEVVKEIK